jgi:hypothetical protein
MHQFGQDRPGPTAAQEAAASPLLQALVAMFLKPEEPRPFPCGGRPLR